METSAALTRGREAWSWPGFPDTSLGEMGRLCPRTHGSGAEVGPSGSRSICCVALVKSLHLLGLNHPL